MPISEKDLAVLYHNQMTHFNDLRSRGIDPGISDDRIYELIRLVFTNTQIPDIFTLHVMSKPESSFKYIHAKKDPQQVTPSESARAEEIELVMELYKPTLRNIDMISPTQFESESLIETFAQEYRKTLDYKIVQMAVAASKMPENGQVFFDAESITELPNIRALLSDVSEEVIKQLCALLPQDSYLHRAQEVSQGIEKIGDLMFNDIMRGGVSKIITGNGSSSYLRLNSGFTTKGNQPRIGVYRIGEIYGIPVYRAPSIILPENECLCIWKNDNNECDVSIAVCVHTPFFYDPETKLYFIKGDFVTLEPKYIKKLTIVNLRSLTL